MFTLHYYRGDASQSTSTIERLLAPDEEWAARLTALNRLSQETHVPYRINEVNSYSSGGKVGVSDTFSSALWCLDFLFLLASHGCGGVNMETDINQHGWVSHYSPIAHDAAGICFARPEYYGMLAFSLAGKGDLLSVTLAKSDINLNAYAAKDDQGSLWVTVINKDLARDAALEVTLPEGCSSAECFRLTAPSAQSQDQVTFAGAEVSEDGKWTPKPGEKITVTQGIARLLVTHASAVLVRLRK